MNIYKQGQTHINPILHNAQSLFPLASRFFTASAAHLANAYSSENEEQESNLDSSCVIRDKDLLHKTQNGGLRILELIDSGSIQLEASLYNKLLNESAKLGRIREGKDVHQHLLRSRFRDYQVVLNSVVNMYAKCGCLEDARKVFDEMPVRDVVSWTALITGFSQHESGGVLQPRLTFEQQLKLGSATAEPGVLPRGHWQPNMSLLKQLDLLNHLCYELITYPSESLARK
uniref:Pentatricopeptide repeat-containing protein n=1 Tax=Daucus carota subsp. sativus TaxID=79200 RepID=A0A164ZGQ6_DAUCS